MDVLYSVPEQGSIITRKACNRWDVQPTLQYDKRDNQKLIITAQITLIFPSVILNFNLYERIWSKKFGALKC
jgi:hypothetical protein